MLTSKTCRSTHPATRAITRSCVGSRVATNKWTSRSSLPGRSCQNCLPRRTHSSSPTLAGLTSASPIRSISAHRHYKALASNFTTSNHHNVYLTAARWCSTVTLGPGGNGWPQTRTPVEVFEAIGERLSRDDLLRMRLVNHEFEKKISGRIFKSVVVPFQPDIYGMLDGDTGRIALRLKGEEENGTNFEPRQNSTHDGHGRVTDLEFVSEVSSGNIPRPTPDGMEIFKGWGRHIKQFAMSCEIDQRKYFIFQPLHGTQLFNCQSNLTKRVWNNHPRNPFTRRISRFGVNINGQTLIIAGLSLWQTWKARQTRLVA